MPITRARAPEQLERPGRIGWLAGAPGERAPSATGEAQRDQLAGRRSQEAWPRPRDPTGINCLLFS